MVNNKEQKTPNEELETINVGIVGHIDHGKTTLLYKISGKWTDTHSEELKRGITIKLGYADIILYKKGETYNKETGTPIKHISFVDAPGHEMLMATMLSGAAMIDAAILVIAANEGIKAQTKEHLMALQAKQVPYLIVVQNKIDLVSKEQAEKNYKEIRELLKGRYENSPIIPVSAQQSTNLEYIYQALAEIPKLKRNLSGEPIFIIARSFDINKPGIAPNKLHGAVLGGILKQGILKIGEEIEIKPGKIVKEANNYHYKTLKTKVIKLFKGTQEVNELTPGGSASVETSLDMSLGKSDSLSGNIASIKDKLPQLVNELKIKFNLFSEIYSSQETMKNLPLKPSELLMLSIDTSITGGVVKNTRGNEAYLLLKIPVIAFKGEKIGIARSINNHWRLIGYGEII